jgi:hypothetical protein
MSNGTDTTVTGGTGGTGTTNTGVTTGQSTLSASFGPYVQDMLSKGWGAANQAYQPFTGDRFAATPDALKNAFTGFQNLGTYNPTQFNTGLGALGSVQDYMNPYTSGVTDIAAREARRQADISRQSEQARLSQAGAYGGSRQAIMEAERQRNLGQQISDINIKGLQAAFDQAQKQRLAESELGLKSQQYGEQAQQYGAKFGLDALQQQMAAGEKERAIAQQPLDFGYQQFQESLKYPYQQATYMQSLLQGLPLEAPKYSEGDSLMGALTQGGIGGLALYQLLFGNQSNTNTGTTGTTTG